MTGKARLLVATNIPLFLALAACGGGGGGGTVNSVPTPAAAPNPVPPTPPPPPPPPPSINTNTTEFSNSAGIDHANATVAYDEGATGAGITVAVLDSGIDEDSSEFAGRISAASRDIAGSRGIDDESGHGTSVSAVIAANRDNANVVGMAFDSTLLVLRTDEPGSCADTGPDGGCLHNTGDLADAIDIAVRNNARTINISLGGGGTTQRFRNAVARAANAGIVIVISAGNEGEEPEGDNPDGLALVALSAEANGHVIIAGSVDRNDAISDFSNRAGDGQAFYLGALGERVRSFDETGTNYLFSGTSYSAPQITAAVALLASAFPNLTGSEIVQLLFQSARDGGTAGDDAIYGQGILDLREAFRPQGSTSLAGSATPVSMASNITLSAPMGDARQSGTGAIILDGFSRAFAIDLADTVRRSTPSTQLADSLAVNRGGQFIAPAGSDAILAFTIDARATQTRIARLALRGEDARRARVAAGMIAAQLDASTRIAFAVSQDGGSVGARLNGRVRPAFLIAREAVGDSGFSSRADTSFALHRRAGALGVTIVAERGQALSPHDRDQALARDAWLESGYTMMGIAADRQWGGLRLDGGLSLMAEDETFLGARFSEALGGGQGSTSLFADIALRWAGPDGWSLGGNMRHGWSFANGSGAVLRGGTLRSFAVSADISKTGILADNDRLSLRVAQPLRVYRGGLRLNLPTSYDYALQTPGYENRFFNLAPEGRQIDMEAAYSRRIGQAWLTGHLFYRRDPGHYASIDNDMGGAIRFTLGF
ncbi:S8 family peptidase [Parasphingopyxis lamellibrachiae]|uniref:Subtilase family protein n=1 Tax=Parasphingopyxis lamellibrachiae TaxID=680125 RepID=A0A3D9FHZ4_9SPHN|nr:S8 family peptidase [Parasphingopyxis lamellibrachiae]RED17192.1 subtilase family protein [Parasphingopyxis lamellibrachiae]